MSRAPAAPAVAGHRMADDAFRADQRARLRQPHVAPLTDLVDALNRERPHGRGVVPHVPPHYGGVRAAVLTLMSNPGPRAGGDGGSGFVSCENPAPSSARLAATYAAAGLGQHRVTPWNAVPWYVHDGLRGRTTAAMRQEGAAALARLLALLPALRVVVLHGADARDGWARLVRSHPEAVAGRDLAALATWHTSNQVFAVPAPVRAEREHDLVDTYVEALGIAT